MYMSQQNDVHEVLVEFVALVRRRETRYNKMCVKALETCF
jgi:hypothetical protein